MTATNAALEKFPRTLALQMKGSVGFVSSIYTLCIPVLFGAFLYGIGDVHVYWF
jgi:hypothetical protein